ncbi:MAG: recombinase family protein [Butyricicoccus pullicaecorum]|nr:recombinase family protein [Butyricicoccus pullicaecorum]
MANHLKLADTYYRLSDEEKKYGNESESITNQREIVREYCQRNGIIIIKEFVDDGYSGGNFERPGFQAMLEHLATGKANTVITKDLSRLGRDMTESSYYAERFFPEHDIRYLAPGNDFDSMGDNLMAPFQFAMNDVYLRDTSRKVKQTLDMKRKKGKYAACPPYGYKKAERTTDQLVPDENTAPIVRQIFAWAADGLSARSIAVKLNQQGAIPPLKYRVEYRDHFTPQGASRASDYWNGTTVKRILRNRVYLGHTILGKSRKVNVKSKKKIAVPQEEWCCTENTHEPLVTQEQFDRAEHFLSENTKSHAANPAFRHSIFGGIAYCAHCGAAMCSGGSVYKGERAKYWYLVCNHITKRSQRACAHGARIRYDDLLEIVRSDLNTLLTFSKEEVETITQAAIARSSAGFDTAESKEKTLEHVETQMQRIVKMVERAYRDNAAGNLSDELLDEMMERFGKERQALEEQRRQLLSDVSEETTIRDSYRLFFDLAKRYSDIETLDRDILHAFIERIEIGEKILPEGKVIAGPRTPYRQSIRIFYRFIGEVAADPVRQVKRAVNL